MNYNILVVDDEKELADVIELYLTGNGCTVYKCYTGAEKKIYVTKGRTGKVPKGG